MFGHHELDVPLPIKEVDPDKLLANGNPLRELTHVAEMPVHKSLVKAYRKNPEGPILIDGPNILDGHHRAMAAFLSKRKVRAVDIKDWPVQEALADEDWKDVTALPLEDRLEKLRFRRETEAIWMRNGLPGISSLVIWHRYDDTWDILGWLTNRQGQQIKEIGLKTDEVISRLKSIYAKYKINWVEEAFADDDDWKDITPDLQGLLSNAGFTQHGQFTWTYQINDWMKTYVTKESDNLWAAKVYFDTMTLDEFKGSEVEMARWLEAKGNWPKNHFSTWNRFHAAARGKGIREDEDDWKEITRPPERSKFLNAYIEAAYFTDEEQLKEDLEKLHAEGKALDVEEPELDEGTVLEMEEDCQNFEAQNAEDLSVGGTEQGGHDFWLTRNGHGAGFWDGDWPKPQADRLTRSSKAFGEFHLYLGDDGKIYH